MTTIANHPQRNTLRLQLRENLLLRDLRPEQWEALEPLLAVGNYKKGDRLARQGDEEITARLSAVKGIGKWSADIFLMFRLRRMDVWPTGDLGVRKGYALAWQVPVPTEKQLVPLGEPYRPYRSVVAWYCWRAVQLSGDAALTRPESAAQVL